MPVKPVSDSDNKSFFTDPLLQPEASRKDSIIINNPPGIFMDLVLIRALSEIFVKM
jgi:hypothetical protein